jgi:putative transposase
MRKSLINKNSDKTISITQQCKILNLSRASLYYTPKPEYNDIDLHTMNKIDEIYTEHPYYGYRRIYLELLLDYKISIGKDKVLKLMREMGICAIYPKKNTSIANKEHKKYPYLLKNLKITKTNQVWAADITYIRLVKGFCYLVVIMDIFSRKILSYKISNSIDTQFCLDALNEALVKYPKPEIFNTDQGCQFTSNNFTSILLDNKIKISMNSKGRALDNIFVERFFRTLKYEDIYIYRYINMSELKNGLHKFFIRYNSNRRHSSLNNLTPDKFYSINGGGANKFEKWQSA